MGARAAGLAALIAIGLMAVPRAAQTPDLLAKMRAALGGDAAINAVTKFAVNGSVVHHQSQVSISNGYEVSCELPDKFMTTSRSTSDMSYLPRGVGMPVTTVVHDSGFNGSDPINATSPDELPNGMPTVIRPATSTDPGDVAEARRRQVSSARREFLRFVLPRFGKSFPGADVTLEDGGTGMIDGQAVYLVKVTDWGNRVHVLAIDAKTNLPVRMTWQDRPVVLKSLGTVSMTGPAPPSRLHMPVFPADPTAGLADVEHAIMFRKFKRENGLTWPREIAKTVDGRPAETWTLGKANLNPKFKADKFNPSK